MKTKEINRQNFILQLFVGLIGLVVLGLRKAFAQSAHFGLPTQTGTNIQIPTICSPENTIWEVQESTDNKTWTSRSQTNLVNAGTNQVSVPNTGSAKFLRMKMVSDAIVVVPSKTHQVLASGQVLFPTMTNLMASLPPGTFAFKSKFYTGLGQYVNEINGVKESGGLHWTLYINDQPATVGSSQYIIRVGDKIEWRLA